MLNFNKKVGNLEGKATKLMEKTESLLIAGFRATGRNERDVLSGLDTNSGAIIGGSIDLCKELKGFIPILAATLDKVTKDLDELKDMNEDLHKQNDELRQMLRDLDRTV